MPRRPTASPVPELPAGLEAEPVHDQAAPEQAEPVHDQAAPSNHGGYRHGIRGGSVQIGVRLSPEQVAALEAWRPGVGRADAIREALAGVVPGWPAGA